MYFMEIKDDLSEADLTFRLKSVFSDVKKVVNLVLWPVLLISVQP